MLGFSGFVYMTYGRQTASSFPSLSIRPSTQSNKQNNPTKDREDFRQIENQLNNLSQNPTEDGIQNFKQEIETLADSPEKTQFLEKLTALESDLTIIANIQENLSLAETTVVLDYFSAAQTGIDSLTSESKKEEFQTQLNTFYTNLTGLEWTR